ncbi:MAG: DinB family protein [Pirellulaceae bacterium]
MNAVSWIQRLHEHREWVNRQLLDAARRLSHEQLDQSFAIGQGSVRKSLFHLFAAEFVWLAALQGNPSPVAPGDAADGLPGNQQAADAIRSLAELEQHWTELAKRWRSYLAGLSESSLEEPVAKISSSSAMHRTRRGDILLHVCTHAQYTTAQLINMLRHLGVTPLPDAMLITLARHRSSPSENA